MLLRRVSVFAALFVAVAAHAQDVTGVWKGRVSGPESCPGGGTVTLNADVNVTLQQSGSTVTGSGSLQTQHDPCVAGSPIDTLSITAVNATLSGSTLSGTITLTSQSSSNVTIFSATVTGNTMSFTVGTSSTDSATGTLTKQAAPSSDITGTWGGTFNANDRCGYGQGVEITTPWSSPATFVVQQNGGSLSGAVILYSVPLTGERCTVERRVALVLPFTGSLSGSTINGTIFTGEPGVTNGSVSGNNLTISMSNSGGFSATGSFTKSSGDPVDSHLSGSYSGAYTGVFYPCPTQSRAPAPIPISGSMTGTLTQTGQALTGTLTVTGQKQDSVINGNCVVTDLGPQTSSIGGLISGGTLSVVLFPDTPGGQLEFFSANISGTTITGQGADFTFSMAKNGSPAATPRILSFVATPPAIRTGQPATLSWSTDAASSVSIDNGLGSQPGGGSVVVTPAATTTYTLTASQDTQSVTASVTVEVVSAPVVNVTAFPATMLEVAGIGGATTTYAITNSGSASTTVSLSQNGDFFTQSPASVTLAPGDTAVITITGTAQAEGSYEGASLISGAGVPSGLQVPVKLVAAPAPAGSVTADPSENRVDVAGDSGSNPSGSVSFRNNGTGRLIGVLNSDVPWILPRSGTVTIEPGQTATLTFTIDRDKRPDSSAPAGSREGNLTLSFLSGSGSSFAAKGPMDGSTAVPTVSLVKVVDTVKPAVTTGGIPPLGPGELALFVAGVGHTTGTKGALFVSDVSILNPQGGRPIDDVKMYYASTSGSSGSAQTASLPAVAAQGSIAVGDIVKSVFSGNDERGSLQIRSRDADKLALAATVLTTNNPAGTYGNTIPVFRSDRSAAPGESLVLSGVKKDSSTHTNVYVQETSGTDASVQVDYLGADGSTVGSDTKTVSAFKLLALDNSVPANAVAVVVTNKSGGRVAAYATPVDEASGDTWAIADWARTYGYAPGDPIVIPVAGSVHGANNTFFRTDVALTNRGTASTTGTLRYVSRTGSIAEQEVSLGAKETRVITDVVGSFSISGDTVGYLTFTPLGGNVAVSSRTFTTAGSKPDTFGAAVPALSAGSALRTGDSRPIAGLADAARATVVAGKPSTYRTNFALMETAGSQVTVRVTFRYTFPAGEKVQGIGAASRDYTLDGNQFLLLNSVAGEILGPVRLQYGDLTNVEADFQVVSGGGAVMLFTSSVDNATGDTILRTE